ncbi:hypothetical protein E4T56_gene7124 [Termitomyces sp. T112]|nr:hypothetical protein E4T56_gene7124 [Termitomyces sp. T112]
MQSVFVISIFAIINTVFAIPSGHVSIPSWCDIDACVTSLASTVESCAEAASGNDLSADAQCVVDAFEAGADFPVACEECLEDFIP